MILFTAAVWLSSFQRLENSEATNQSWYLKKRQKVCTCSCQTWASRQQWNSLDTVVFHHHSYKYCWIWNVLQCLSTSGRAYNGCESASFQWCAFLPAISNQDAAACDLLVHTLFWKENFYVLHGELTFCFGLLHYLVLVRRLAFTSRLNEAAAQYISALTCLCRACAPTVRFVCQGALGALCCLRGTGAAGSSLPLSCAAVFLWKILTLRKKTKENLIVIIFRLWLLFFKRYSYWCLRSRWCDPMMPLTKFDIYAYISVVQYS